MRLLKSIFANNSLVVLNNIGRSLSKAAAATSWSHVEAGPPDVILGVTEAFLRDTNPQKINLGAGAYRDDAGKPFILPSVQKAEKKLQSQNLNHEYAPIGGLPEFCLEAAKLAFGDDSSIIKNKQNATVQSISGTGSLAVGAAFLSKFAKSKTIWVPTPTWGNHAAIFKLSQLNVATYRYYDATTCGFDFHGCMEDLAKVPSGDTVLLHACAHNPTGVDPTQQQWEALSELFSARRLIPFFDMAYQGFATGDVDRDAFPVRHFLERGRVEQHTGMLLAQSFAKNMGLYGQRVGAFSLVGASEEEAARVMSQIKIVIRSLYSNPPIHGARIAHSIMSDTRELRADWLADVRTMSDRIKTMRAALRDGLETRLRSSRDWSHITNQIGMFCFTGLTPDQVDRITQEFSVYLTRDGRISIAGLSTSNVQYLADAIHAVTK